MLVVGVDSWTFNWNISTFPSFILELCAIFSPRKKCFARKKEKEKLLIYGIKFRPTVFYLRLFTVLFKAFYSFTLTCFSEGSEESLCRKSRGNSHRVCKLV